MYDRTPPPPMDNPAAVCFAPSGKVYQWDGEYRVLQVSQGQVTAMAELPKALQEACEADDDPAQRRMELALTMIAQAEVGEAQVSAEAAALN